MIKLADYFNRSMTHHYLRIALKRSQLPLQLAWFVEVVSIKKGDIITTRMSHPESTSHVDAIVLAPRMSQKQNVRIVAFLKLAQQLPGSIRRAIRP